MNKLIEEDFIDYQKFFDWGSKELDGKKLLITGSTGLIASLLTKFLIFVCPNIKIIAPVRNISKANKIFTREELKNITICEFDLISGNYLDLTESCDYIIHGVAPTASCFFVTNPVDTFETIVNGTSNILKFAKDVVQLESFVYLSSLEIYGDCDRQDINIDEEYQGYVKIESARSSYPMGKRAAENLCYLYKQQYGVPVKVARLTQVTGAGIDMSDNRVFTQFCKCKYFNTPITLHTAGRSSRPYCYTMDAILGILTILLKGKDGTSYNVANEETYISAYNLAKKISKIPPKIGLHIEYDDSKGYANETFHNLSALRLRELGWAPRKGIDEIADRLIKYIAIEHETGNF